MATLVLVIWPIIAIALFNRFGLSKGLILSVCIGYLLLPENFAIPIPGFVDYNKVGAISLAVLLGVWVAGSAERQSLVGIGRVTESRLMHMMIIGCLILIFVGAVMTWRTNREALIFSEHVARAIRMYDVISIAAGVIMLVIPYFLARRYLVKPEHHHYILMTILVSGLIYSVVALWEIRMSPQMHITVYGYFQHNFGQHIRNGFRPVVFLDHALSLGFFLVTALLAAIALARRESGKKRATYLWAALWLYVILILAKSFGAIFIGTVCGAMLLFLNTRLLIRVSAVVAIMFLVFPAARQANIIPIDNFIALTNSINADRTGSFEFRLKHEDAILARALEKPIAGWGPWARWRVRDERGRDETVADGLWIIILGERGWAGYLSFFGLLVLPIFMLTRIARRREVSVENAGMSVIMMANFIYLVPNSTLSPIAWMITGSLAGTIQYAHAAPKQEDTSDTKGRAQGRRLDYSRFEPRHKLSRERLRR